MSRRGLWDRSVAPSERHDRQRQRIVHAAARSIFEMGRAVTVSDVVRQAGVGRNTFYARFVDLREVFAEGESEALKRVGRALSSKREIRTPVERLRRLASDWLDLAQEESHLVSLVVRGDGTPNGAHGRVRAVIMDALRSTSVAGRAAGIIGRPVDETRLMIAAHAFIGAAERVVEGTLRTELGALAADLADATLRILR